MAAFLVRVDVTHLPGVADPAGATVERALPALGWSNATRVSIAKTIRLQIECDSEADARIQADAMCQRLLVNPVIEAYEVNVEAVVPA